MGDPSQREREKERPTSRPLHNFTLPTPLKWGNQKQLRCMKLQPNFSPAVDRRSRGGSNHADGLPRPPPVNRRSPMGPFEPKKEKDIIIQVGGGASGGGVGGGGGSEIEVVRQKLTTDLRVEADRMKQNFIDENEKKKPSEEELNASRPWNLRRRRGESGSNSGGGGNAGLSHLRRPESGLRRLEEEVLRGESSSSGGLQRPKFSLTLTKEEIEADFIAMTGAKPPRRPKKRPKAVQKQIDGLFPGSWLREVTPDTYKVPDNGDQGKGEKAKGRNG